MFLFFVDLSNNIIGSVFFLLTLAVSGMFIYLWNKPNTSDLKELQGKIIKLETDLKEKSVDHKADMLALKTDEYNERKLFNDHIIAQNVVIATLSSKIETTKEINSQLALISAKWETIEKAQTKSTETTATLTTQVVKLAEKLDSVPEKVDRIEARELKRLQENQKQP